MGNLTRQLLHRVEFSSCRQNPDQLNVSTWLSTFKGESILCGMYIDFPSMYIPRKLLIFCNHTSVMLFTNS